MHTSGTGGTMGIFVHDRSSWTRFRGVTAVRSSMELNYNPFRRNRFAYFDATHGRFAGITSVITAPKLITNALTYSVLDPVEKTVSHVNRFKPEFMVAYPSALKELAINAMAGKLSIRASYILCAEGGHLTTLDSLHSIPSD